MSGLCARYEDIAPAQTGLGPPLRGSGHWGGPLAPRLGAARGGDVDRDGQEERTRQDQPGAGVA